MVQRERLTAHSPVTGKVCILLSTYNGIRFLKQQIDSLLAQSYPHIVITIRDDGSTDGTYEAVLEYGRRCPNFVVLGTERLGIVESYLTLLRQADQNCDFYAFCDQDDVWLPDKIRDAVSAMESYDVTRPLMYCSRLEYVDLQLRHLGYSRDYRRLAFRNALVENVATGCTIVLNREARRQICEQTASCVAMHDWWCYLVVSALGEVIYDERPNIRYRQHGANEVGVPTNAWQVCRRLLARYLDPDKSGIRASDQAKEFHRLYAHKLKQPELSILEDFVAARGGIWSRIKYAAKIGVWKQSRWETAFLPVRIIAGRF